MRFVTSAPPSFILHFFFSGFPSLLLTANYDDDSAKDTFADNFWTPRNTINIAEMLFSF